VVLDSSRVVCTALVIRQAAPATQERLFHTLTPGESLVIMVWYRIVDAPIVGRPILSLASLWWDAQYHVRVLLGI
jgi:hypothetical protein